MSELNHAREVVTSRSVLGGLCEGIWNHFMKGQVSRATKIGPLAAT